jgi:predicted amidohydrolase
MRHRPRSLAGITACLAEARAGELVVLPEACLSGYDDTLSGLDRNAAIYLAPDGTRRVHRKVNLATHKRGRLAAGTELPVLPLRLDGGSLAVGVQLCREIVYPEVIDTEDISGWYLGQRRTDLLRLRYQAPTGS